MPIETDLSVSPYFNTFDPSDSYHRILFRPGVSVQVRELNELQSILYHQIEKFGDNIFKKGTIIEGCDFKQVGDRYKYIKILDTDYFGEPVNITTGLRSGRTKLKNANNLIATLQNTENGYEATAPDLKTIIIKYENNGDSGEEAFFEENQVIEVFETYRPISSILIDTGSLGFSNSDVLVITPQYVVNVTSGSFTAGDYIIDPLTGANLEILEVDNALHSGYSTLKVSPRNEDLANSDLTSASWVIQRGSAVTNQDSDVAGTLVEWMGVNAAGTIITDAVGKVTSIILPNGGTGYYVNPDVKIRSIGNESGLSGLSLIPRNFIAKWRIASGASAVGNSFVFEMSPGYMYQKGTFIKVNDQKVLVSKYNNQPNNVSVVFKTDEEIFNSNKDGRLLDNALGTENYTAPGANRLKLSANLIVMNTDIAQESFDTTILCSYSEGRAYLSNQLTTYGPLGDELARRTSDTSGDFVLNRFEITTKSPVDDNYEGNTYSLVIDPGKAYISGYKVSTQANQNRSINKVFSTQIQEIENLGISVDYKNCLHVTDMAGYFQFNTGDEVELYDTESNKVSSVSNAINGTITPSGTKIGIAKVRGLFYEQGQQGTSTAIYKMYLFDIRMTSQSKSITDVRSVYYNGTVKGIADAKVKQDINGSNNAVFEKLNNKMLFETNFDIQNLTNVGYDYRTTKYNAQLNSNGSIFETVSSDPNARFSNTGSFSSQSLRSLYVAPTVNVYAASALAGTANAVNGSNVLSDGAGTAYLNDLAVGDYVYIYANSVSFDKKQVTSILNNGEIQLDSNLSFSNNTTYVKRYFPAYIPLAFGNRDGYSAVVTANQNNLEINTGLTSNALSAVNTIISYDVSRYSLNPGTKSAERNLFVKICLANNVAGAEGPWCLGVSDVFRLRGVYTSTSNTVNTNSLDITRYFHVDNNQVENYLDLSYLYTRSDRLTSLTSSDWLLVEFDAFDTPDIGDYYVTSSYVGSNTTDIQATDSKPLANLSSDVSSWEIPEFNTVVGNKYYDLTKVIDFRPVCSNTALLTSNADLATINPEDPVDTLGVGVNIGDTANNNNERYWPIPQSTLIGNLTYYIPRKDRVLLTKTGEIKVTSTVGFANTLSSSDTEKVRDALILGTLYIPTYPIVPIYPSDTVKEILDKKIQSNGQELNWRINRSVIRDLEPINSRTKRINQPKRYSMNDIGKLDTRLKNVEYQVSLSQIENGIRNTIIPSSIDPTVDRFKFGFFVDDFSNSNLADKNDVEYAAYISPSEGRLYPARNAVELVIDNISEDAQEVNIINQYVATDGPWTPPATPTPIVVTATVTNVVTTTVTRTATVTATITEVLTRTVTATVTNTVTNNVTQTVTVTRTVTATTQTVTEIPRTPEVSRPEVDDTDVDDVDDVDDWDDDDWNDTDEDIDIDEDIDDLDEDVDADEDGDIDGDIDGFDDGFDDMDEDGDFGDDGY